jgi:hypothetical protein
MTLRLRFGSKSNSELNLLRKSVLEIPAVRELLFYNLQIFRTKKDLSTSLEP